MSEICTCRQFKRPRLDTCNSNAYQRKSIFEVREIPSGMRPIEVYTLFKSIGPICELKMVKRRIGISFIRTERVIQMKSQKQVEIAGNTFNIKWLADDHLSRVVGNIDDSLLLPPDQQSDTNILNSLNDDCLRLIFEVNRLDIWDLCSLASTCKRFKVIADTVIESKYRDVSSFPHIKSKMLCKVEDYLVNTGPKILVIKTECFNYILCQMIAKYCTNARELDCVLDAECNKGYKDGRNGNNDNILAEMRPLLKHLRKLKICFAVPTHSVTWDLGQLFGPNCTKSDYPLEELKLEISENYRVHIFPTMVFPQIGLPKLKRISLNRFQLEGEDVMPFFKLNPQIDSLWLLNSKLYLGVGRMLRGLDNIQELGLYDVSSTCTEERGLSQLKTLKRCKMSNPNGLCRVIIETLAEYQAPVEWLSLKQLSSGRHNSISSICRLTTIEYLRIEFLEDQQLHLLLRHLPRLKNIVSARSHAITMAGIFFMFELIRPQFVSASFMDVEDFDMSYMDAIDRTAESRKIEVTIRHSGESSSEEEEEEEEEEEDDEEEEDAEEEEGEGEEGEGKEGEREEEGEGEKDE